MPKKLTYLNVFSGAKAISVAVAVFSVGLTAADVGMRRCTGNLIDALNAGGVQGFGWMTLGLLALLLVALNFMLPYGRARLANQIQQRLYVRLEDKALGGEQDALSGISPGEASTYFASDVTGIVGYVNRVIGVGLPDGFTFLFGAAVLCFINPWLGIAAIAASILPVLLMFFMSKALVQLNTGYQGVMQRINQKTANDFYNLELIKASALEKACQQENAGLLKELLQQKRRQSRREAVLSFPTMLSTFLTILSLSVLGGYFVQQGAMQIGELFTAITLADCIVSPVMRFENTISQIRRAKASFNRINRFLNLPEEGETADYFHGGADSGPISLEILKLAFAYPNGKRVFDAASFLWKQGKLHVIVGENGAGKSTLLKLLSGVYQPQDGSVVIHGAKLPEHLTRRELREQIIIDTQQTLLFPGTVRYNLTRGLPIGEQKIASACRAVGIDQEIHRLSDGYETLLGADGSPLSGGQKRRLCLARTLLREGCIYLFDEPTTGVDPAHIHLLIQMLGDLAKEKLVIVLTHEPLLIQAADTVTEWKASS